jgi:uncharacterized membrane protein
VNKRVPGIILLLVFMAVPGFLQACQAALPTFEVLSLNITPPKVTPGEKATVEVEISNSNAEVDTYNVPLMVNGVADDRKRLTLAPGETKLITFVLTKNQVGAYRVSVGDKETSLVVQEILPPEFHLSDLEINPPQANTGDKITITAKITNTGGTQGSYTAELKIDGITNQTEKATVAAGTDHMLSFKVCADCPGTYEVALGGLTGQFVITEPVKPVQSNNPTTTSPPPSPGYRKPPRC